MFRDAREVPKDQLIERDLCIIGAGAAGITIARELAGSGLSVALLESGGRKSDRETQALYAGGVASTHLAEDSDYLSTSRLRFFGGTTNHWAGLCAPFAPIDFQPRSWIPNSGWPFDRAHLDPWYARAAPILGVGPFDEASAELEPMGFGSGIQIGSVAKHFSKPTRFGPEFAAELAASGSVDVFLHANVIELRSDPQSSRVEWVQVATLSGNAFRVSARCFVLATGGIENARLMLNSNAVQERGLGNQNDLVGRYFMDHLFQLGDPARVVLAATRAEVDPYVRAIVDPRLELPVLVRFVLSERVQRDHELPHDAIGLSPREKPGPGSLMGALGSVTSDLSPTGGPWFGVLGMDIEPSPDPDNRVVLGEERDALGMRRAKLRWNVPARDREGALRYLAIFARELGRSLRGRVRIQLTPEYDWSRFVFSAHHIGTTRMHDDPRHGVVDARCQVHGIENLYVAGSSVFPTAGLVNPTFTIVALALRLADRLTERLRT